MDIRFLESFVVVAECGSIAEAARRLNLTPAALAQRLRALEQDIGQALVARAGRSVRPTAAGLAVLRHARGVIDGARDLRAIAANDQPEGQLRLGATATALTGLLPAALEKLRALYPRIDLFIQPGSSLDLYQGVVAGDMDAALMVQPPYMVPKSTGWLTLREESLILIAPADAAALSPVALLGEYRFIRYDRNSWGGQIVDRFLRRSGWKVREWLELDALDAIATLVSRGLGVAVVPDWAPPWPEGLRVRKLALPDGASRQTGILWKRSGARIAAVRALVDVCAKIHPADGG